MKKTLVALTSLWIFSCTSTSVAPTPPKAKPIAPTNTVVDSSTPQNLEVENIDMDGLQNFLRLRRRFDQLGYAERKFNTCEVGYGFSSTHNCRSRVYVVIHFQLMCRHSEGTISRPLTDADLSAIARQNVKWNLKNATGQILTDSEGYGEIAMISEESQRFQRLRLTVRNDFLFLKAGEITQMITPKDWCE